MAKEPLIKTDEICDDPHIAHLKQVQQEKFKRHATLSSIGDAAKFIAGPMFAIGISTLITVMAGVSAIPLAVPLALLGFAAAALTVGVGSSYAATRIWTDGQFNNCEISAKSTAHHMIEELKNMGAEQAVPTDNRWQEYVSSRGEQQQTRIH